MRAFAPLLRRHNNQGDNEISVGNLRLNVTPPPGVAG